MQLSNPAQTSIFSCATLLLGRLERILAALMTYREKSGKKYPQIEAICRTWGQRFCICWAAHRTIFTPETADYSIKCYIVICILPSPFVDIEQARLATSISLAACWVNSSLAASFPALAASTSAVRGSEVVRKVSLTLKRDNLAFHLQRCLILTWSTTALLSCRLRSPTLQAVLSRAVSSSGPPPRPWLLMYSDNRS